MLNSYYVLNITTYGSGLRLLVAEVNQVFIWYVCLTCV